MRRTLIAVDIDPVRCWLCRWPCWACVGVTVVFLAGCGGDERGAERRQAPAQTPAPAGLVAYWEAGAVVVEPLDGSSERRFVVGAYDENKEVSGLWIAPSGKQIAFYIGSGLFVLELASGSVQQLEVALEPGEMFDYEIAWAPDERTLAFGASRLRSFCGQHATDIRLITITREGTFRRTKNVIPPTAAPTRGNPTSIGRVAWSPDGEWLFYEVWQGSECETRGQYLREVQMTVMPVSGGKPRAFAQIHFPPRPSWAADGTPNIAFAPDPEGDGELTTVNVKTGKSTRLGYFVGDVIWTRRGIYAYEPYLERLMLVPADGDPRPTIVARKPFGRVAAAPATGDWVAVCDQYCQQLTVYSHDGKRLFGRFITDGEAVIAAVPR